MNPETVITAEMLDGLGSCPFCGAPKETRGKMGYSYKCFTDVLLNHRACEFQSPTCKSIHYHQLCAHVIRYEKYQEKRQFDDL